MIIGSPGNDVSKGSKDMAQLSDSIGNLLNVWVPWKSLVHDNTIFDMRYFIDFLAAATIAVSIITGENFNI